MNSGSTSGTERGRAWIGYLVAAGCLVWVFHDTRLGDLFGRVRTMTWWLLIPAVAADVASYAAQGARWSLLVRPLGRLPVLRATQIIYAALFTNEVLPLRVGEVLRGYLASRWTSLSMAKAFSSILVERFLDGIWTALSFGIVVLVVPLPKYLVDAEEALALAIFAAAAVFVYLVVRKERQLEAASKSTPAAGSALRRQLARLVEYVAAALLSGLLLALQVLSFWLVMEAYGLRLSVWHGTVVLLIVHVGTMLPGAPSNVGTYQFFTVAGLLLFGVDKTIASGFSVVVFLILTIPLWILGLVAFGRAGLTIPMVREEIARLRNRPRQAGADNDSSAD